MGHFQKVIAMVQMGGGSELAIVISIVVCCVLLLLCTVGTSLLIHHSSDSTGVALYRRSGDLWISSDLLEITII